MTGAVPLNAPYPAARRDESTSHAYPSVQQGKDVQVADPYFWLEQPPNASPEVEAFVKQQAQLTEDYLSKSQSTRDAIKEEVSRIWNYEKMGVPNLKGDGYYYFSHNSGLQSQAPIYRVHESKVAQPDQNRELFYDPNLLSEDGTVAVNTASFSESGKYWAYALSKSGSDWTEIYVRPTDAPHKPDQPIGSDQGRMPDVIRWVKFSGINWSKDEKGFFYSRLPPPPGAEGTGDHKAGTETEANVNAKVYYHRLGTDQAEDILIAEDPTSDKSQLMFAVNMTPDGEYALKVCSRDTSRSMQLYIAKVDGGVTPGLKDAFKPAVTEWDSDYDYIANDGPVFYFQTNRDGAMNDKVVKYNFDKPDEGFTDHIPADDNAVLCYSGARGEDKMILIYKKDVIEHLYLHELGTGKRICELEAGDIGAFGSIGGRRKDSQFYITKGSYSNPSSMFHVDLDKAAGQMVSLYRETKLDGVDPSDYTTEQEFFTSKDGTRVPMFLFSRKGFKKDGTRPALLYGYGGFNISVDPAFSPSFMAFVKGFDGVVAVANIRGGSEYGQSWHDEACKDKRQNAFDDFQAAAKHLRDNKWAGSVISSGGSNGGALVAACANQAPHLFDATIPEVGVLDMLRYQYFTIGWAWAADYGRSDEEGFDYLIKWSPLHNVPTNTTNYPATLLSTSDHDDRVSPLHSFKFGATLQHAIPQNDKPILLRLELNAGHSAGMSTEKRIQVAVDKWTFVASALGLKWGQ